MKFYNIEQTTHLNKDVAIKIANLLGIEDADGLFHLEVSLDTDTGVMTYEIVAFTNGDTIPENTTQVFWGDIPNLYKSFNYWFGYYGRIIPYTPKLPIEDSVTVQDVIDLISDQNQPLLELPRITEWSIRKHIQTLYVYKLVGENWAVRQLEAYGFTNPNILKD